MAETAPNIALDIVFEEDEIGAGAGDVAMMAPWTRRRDGRETEKQKVVVEVPEITAWGVVWRGMSKVKS